MQIKNIIAAVAGIILLLLGVVGIVVPVLPTTPFVIGAVACFSGMPKLRKWVISMPVFGEHIINYKAREGLKTKTVVISLTFLWTMLLISCVVLKSMIMTLLLILIGVAVTVHILCMRKPKRGKLRSDDK